MSKRVFLVLISVLFARSLASADVSACEGFFEGKRTFAFESKNKLRLLTNSLKRLRNFPDLETSFLLDIKTKRKVIVISPTNTSTANSKTVLHAREEILDLESREGKIQVAYDESYNPLLDDLLLRTDKTSDFLKERARTASASIEKELDETAQIKVSERRFVKAISLMFYIPPTALIAASYFTGFDLGIPIMLASYYPIHLLRNYIAKQLETSEVRYDSSMAAEIQVPQPHHNQKLHDGISQDIADHFLSYSRQQDLDQTSVLVVPHSLKAKVIRRLQTLVPYFKEIELEELQLIYEAP